MKLSKKDELLALGSALYLMGLEMEGNRARVEELAREQEGGILLTQELMDSIQAFEAAKGKFERLEERYLKLMEELQGHEKADP